MSLQSSRRHQVGATQSIRSGLSRDGQKGRPSRPTSINAGFSLLEVLATLMVTMLLVLSLMPFVTQMLATWARGGEVVGFVELKTRGLNQLRRDLRHAIVLKGYGPLQDTAAFEGNETSLSFPIVAGLGPTEIGIEYVSFSVATSVDGQALIRRRAAMIGSGYGSFVDPVVLLSGPFRYVFKYYPREGEAVPLWTKRRRELPARVELVVADRNGNRLFEQPVIIPAFASISAGCVAGGGQGCPPRPGATEPSTEQMLQSLFSPQGKS
jgi:hypothetical protein